MRIPANSIPGLYDMSLDKVMLHWGSGVSLESQCLFVLVSQDTNSEEKEKVGRWFPDCFPTQTCVTGWLSLCLPSANPQATDCQKKASGMIPSGFQGFYPICDQRGFYQPKQCFMSKCWCVNPLSGDVFLGSMSDENIKCSTAAAAGKDASLIRDLSS